MLYTAVEKEAAEIFRKFNVPTGAKRNTSAVPWIEAFYNATLGPEAAFPGGTVAGIPLQVKSTYMRDPFRAVDS